MGWGIRVGCGLKTSQDLADVSKWALADLPQFKQMMKEVEREFQKWEESKTTCVSYLRELESNMLRGMAYVWLDFRC